MEGVVGGGGSIPSQWLTNNHREKSYVQTLRQTKSREVSNKHPVNSRLSHP